MVREFLRPVLAGLVGRETRLITPALLESCHHNQTLYSILHLDRVYDVENLRQWRDQYNLQAVEDGLVVTSLPDLTLPSGESIREYLAEEWAVKWSQEKSQTYEFSADQMKVVRPEKVRNNP